MALAGLPLTASNYLPLVTVPEWEESIVSYDVFSGDSTRTSSRNLRGADNSMRIISGFNGNTFIESVSISIFGSFEYPFPRVDSWTDYSLTEDGLFRWGNRAVTYSSIQPSPAQVGWQFSERVNWGKNGGDGITSPGVLSDRLQATIGEVVLHEYQSTNIAELPGSALTLILGTDTGATKQTQTTTQTVTVRVAYAGFDTVEGLFPGSDPYVPTPSYKALVRITETSAEGINTVETVGGFLEGTEETSFGPGGGTVVDWLVDGIGSVKSVLVLGDYLDDILNAPIFDKGDGVVSATTLEQIVGGSFDIEIYRVSGGSILMARDAVAVNGKINLAEGYTIPPAPDFRAWWYPELSVGGNWFQVSALGGYIYIPYGMQLAEETSGWVVHYELGDLYVLGTRDNSLWIYNPLLGWTWTANGIYPYFFVSAVGQWTAFAYGEGVKYFYSYLDGKWYSEAEIIALGIGVLGS
jgi:hypothetical protein